MPYPLRGLRVVAAVLWLSLSAVVVLLALHFRVRETVMLGLLAPQVPLAYLVARFAVARARRGDEPDWRRAFAGLARLLQLFSRRRGDFRSPAEAQAWLEWRQVGRSLPALVAVVLPFELSLLFLSQATPVLIVEILLAVLLTPPFLAAFAAAAVGTPNPRGREGHGLSPFLAMRPLTSGDLVGAKLKAALGSVVAAWLLVLIAVPLALQLSGTWPLVIEQVLRFGEAVGTPRAIIGVLLLVLGLIAATWNQLVQSLYLGLTGRAWLVKGSVFLALSLLFLLGPLLQWIADHGEVRGALWEVAPAILAGLVCVKMAIAGWVATRLYHGRLLSDRVLVAGAAGWCVAVLALYGVLVWFAGSPFFPRYVLALVSILAIPLARLSAAPLALAWNRHR